MADFLRIASLRCCALWPCWERRGPRDVRLSLGLADCANDFFDSRRGSCCPASARILHCWQRRRRPAIEARQGAGDSHAPWLSQTSSMLQFSPNPMIHPCPGRVSRALRCGQEVGATLRILRRGSLTLGATTRCRTCCSCTLGLRPAISQAVQTNAAFHLHKDHHVLICLEEFTNMQDQPAPSPDIADWTPDRETCTCTRSMRHVCQINRLPRPQLLSTTFRAWDLPIAGYSFLLTIATRLIGFVVFEAHSPFAALQGEPLLLHPWRNPGGRCQIPSPGRCQKEQANP